MSHSRAGTTILVMVMVMVMVTVVAASSDCTPTLTVRIHGPALSRVALTQRFFTISINETFPLTAADEGCSPLPPPPWYAAHDCTDALAKTYGLSIQIRYAFAANKGGDGNGVSVRHIDLYCLAERGEIRVVFPEPHPHAGDGESVEQTVEITDKETGKIVAKSVVQDVMRSYCGCTLEKTLSSEEWRAGMACPANETQVELDFSKEWWRKSGKPLITRAQFERAFAENAHQVHYAIIDNRLYSRVIGTIVDIRTFVEPFFLELLRTTKVPDVEFVINFSDYPWSRVEKDEPIPVFSMCSTDNHHDLYLPTYDMMISTVRRKHDLLQPCKNTNPLWEERRDAVVWRGSDSNRNRFHFAIEAQELNASHPGIFDIGLSHMVRVRRNVEEHGNEASAMDFCHFFNTKIVANVDGSVAAYRLPFLMSGGSLILKQDSPYREHFYIDMQPWRHYVPFRADNTDLEERVLWILKNKEKAKKIARQGQQWAYEHLNPASVFCYTHTALSKFAASLDFKPSHQGMTEIPPAVNTGPCGCSR